ncbi:MAG: tetratricopeptide repeat protein [Dokdonella sp.]|uniref:tetratricopeptide repeat protein n=1 Tax=Dokdonella sp. TaxID=2291710 RepID=UPI003F80C9E2
MHAYGVSDVEKLLRLPRSTIRALIAAGFVAPARGARNAWQFSFQDLIVLRTAQALAAANIPQRRIVRALKDLRSRLPEEMPLSGLSIGAIADEVVVREGGARWAAESGQYLLAFESGPEEGSLRVIDPAPARAARDDSAGDDTLERRDSAAALAAYDAAIAADPGRVDARINKGRLLHELGRYEEAVRTYLDALQSGVHDALLHYNLGVLLDDLDRKPQARKAYEAALALDPGMADAHYNLALLCEELDQPREAIRHMAQYRRLLAGG